MCSIFTSYLKSSNECVNGIIFPGSTMTSNYWPNTFIADKEKNHVQLIYLPTTEQAHKQFWRGNACIYNDLPLSIPALLIWRVPKATSCILYFHGNAADISHVYRMAIRQSVIYNAHFLAIEYPRYGFSDGHPNQESINAVAHVAYNFLVERLEIPSNRIVIMGNSIGTGPACYLASYLESINKPPAAVILHAPYTTITNVARDVLECLPSCFLNRWSNYPALIGEDDMRTIRCPVLFLHADQDKIIDYEHSLSMHRIRVMKKLPSFLFTQKSTDDFIKGHNHFNYIYDLETPIGSFLKNVISSTSDASSFAIDLSVVEAYSRIPIIYQHRTRENHHKRSYGVVMRWICCPCICSSEACIACTMESLLKIESYFDPPHTSSSSSMNAHDNEQHHHILPSSSPTHDHHQHHMYRYQTKAMRGLDHLTVYTVLRKLVTTGSAANVIEESSQAKAKTGEDKPVVNPMLSSSTTSSPSSSMKTSAVIRRSSSQDDKMMSKDNTLTDALMTSSSSSSSSTATMNDDTMPAPHIRRSNRGSHRGDDMIIMPSSTPKRPSLTRTSNIVSSSSIEVDDIIIHRHHHEHDDENNDADAMIIKDEEPDPGSAKLSSSPASTSPASEEN